MRLPHVRRLGLAWVLGIVNWQAVVSTLSGGSAAYCGEVAPLHMIPLDAVDEGNPWIEDRG